MGITISKQRLEALSDGVYAVALTLLVLDLKLPVKSYAGNDAALLEALYDLLPNVLTWLLSFWVLTTYWLAQVKLYRLTKDADMHMVRNTFAELALISLLPFSTSLIGEHGNHVAAAVIYSLNLLGISILSLIRTTYILKRPVLHENKIEPSLEIVLTAGVWMRLWCTLATLVLAFFYPGWNMIAMMPLALFPSYMKYRHQKTSI